jgi:hypothetical protein
MDASVRPFVSREAGAVVSSRTAQPIGMQGERATSRAHSTESARRASRTSRILVHLPQENWCAW